MTTAPPAAVSAPDTPAVNTGIPLLRRRRRANISEEESAQGFRFAITAEGIMLLIVLILVGFAAWHSGTNLLYLIFSILTAVYLIHGFMLSFNLAGLTATEKLPDVVVAGQPFEVGITLKNRKRRFRSMAISVTHHGSERRHVIGAIYFLHIPRRSTRDAFYWATAEKRGLLFIGSAAIASRYPFGFEERRQIFQRNREILVLPQTWPVHSVAVKIPTGFGDQESEVRGSGTDLYGLREYVAGEPARHVHWRTSARAQKLMIAEYTREERRQVTLVLDNGTTTPDDPASADAFENAITLTASLARHLIETGYEVGLLTQDNHIESGQSPKHLTDILKHLAIIQMETATELTLPANSVCITWKTANSPKTDGVVIIDSTVWHPPSASARHFAPGEKFL